jgi:hypothetical protein
MRAEQTRRLELVVTIAQQSFVAVIVNFPVLPRFLCRINVQRRSALQDNLQDPSQSHSRRSVQDRW